MIATTVSSNRGAGLLVGTSLVTKRVLLRFIRTPQLVIGSLVQTALFLVCFRYVLGGAITTTGGVPYVDFLVPGFIATGVLFAMIGSAVGVAEDLEQGFVDRLRSLPIPRSSVLTGRLVADTVAVTLNLGVATLVGFVVGFLLGHDAAYFVSRALIWAAVIVVVFAPLAVLRYRRS